MHWALQTLSQIKTSKQRLVVKFYNKYLFLVETTNPTSVYYIRNETFDLTYYRPFSTLDSDMKDSIGKNLVSI